MPTTGKPLFVVIGCDTDPDRPDFGGIPFNAGPRKQVWKGLNYIWELRDRLDKITDSRSRSVAITWLLRCDEQIRVTEGYHAQLLKDHAALWQRCERSGDEIAWHPHVWRLRKDGKTWFQEINDHQFHRKVLTEGFNEFAAARGTSPKSVRMGWDYHNNTTMATLSDLGIRIDFSALPYQTHLGTKNDRGAGFVGYYEWSRTRTVPYFPSRQDYQMRGQGVDQLDIIELPVGLLQSKFVGFLSEARGALRDGSILRLLRSLIPGRTIANTSIKACAPTFLFRAMITDILRRGEEWVVTYFHADELIPNKGHFINNWAHRSDYFIRNMQILLKLTNGTGRDVQFITASEASVLLKA